ncbi:MAG: prolipoprotein diacylglyceryl transferase [bacterium]|nr:prolipoprotein diacylglyceryl transferase [bacterium]
MKPIIFESNIFVLHTIWVFFAIAVITGTYALIKLSVKNNLKLQFLSNNSFRLILISIIGARLLAIFANYDIYFYEFSGKTFLSLFAIWDKGLSLWGGIIAFFIFLYFDCKKSEQNFWKWLDVLVPSLILALAIAHIGAFFEGINYGNPSHLPWAVNFESPAIKFAVPIHPSQIYAFLYSGAISTALYLLSQSEKVKTLKEGFIGTIGISLYALLRFLEGFTRGDDTWLILGARMPQIIASIVFISSGIFLFLRYNKRRWKQ